MLNRPFWLALLAVSCVSTVPAVVNAQEDPGAPKGAKPAAEKPVAVAGNRPMPADDTPPILLPTLTTVPTRRNAPSFNQHMVDARVHHRDREGIWVLNFTFKPMRMETVEIPGKGRRTVYYLYYKVVNHVVDSNGKPKPVQFVPQFTLVTDTGKRYNDVVIPQAVKKIQAREDNTIPLLGAVDIMGVLPPSTKEGVDDAVYGVAIWDKVDPKADAFQVFVRGLSDGFQTIQPPKGGEPIVRYKTLRIDFIRRGDEHNVHEKEIQLGEPPYEWIYW